MDSFERKAFCDMLDTDTMLGIVSALDEMRMREKVLRSLRSDGDESSITE